MLAPGTRLGPYEVVSPLGAGGMGEVYRARDTKLGRTVALKILPDVFAGDPDRVARFEREAKTLASLNHPHIAHVYGFEQSADSSALVMELVEGHDLSARVASGPVPLDEALPIAIQVAQALEAAHDQGIIHRDLKPANIKLRADGTVKVLDFGLAKALEQEPSLSGRGAEALNLPTITSPAALTVQGIVLGTATYMSPEQARGRAVDRRTDIWSFGVMLYEMLTGRQLFGAETVSDTIAAVLTREPALDALAPGTPPLLRRLLERCLQKDPARRFHHMADVRLELEQIAAAPASMPEVTERSAGRGWWRAPLAAAIVAAGLTGLSVWGVMSRPGTAPRRYSYTIPDAGFNTVSQSAISPDGRLLAYAPNVYAAPFRLRIRTLETFEEREVLSASSTGFSPFFSADGQWLAFFDDNVLYRVAVSGGVPERIAPAQAGNGDGDWADDGTIVVSANFRIDNVLRRPLLRLAQGGTFEPLTRPGASESHHDPEVLPGSKTVLFTMVTPKSSAIAAVPIGGGAPQIVLTDARGPRYSVAGQLMFQRSSSGELMSVGFDPVRLTIAGEPTRIATVAQVVNSPAFDVARDGTIIYSAPADIPTQAGYTTVAVDRAGVETMLVSQPSLWAEPRVSADGRTLLLRDIVSPNCDLWALDLARGTRTRVTLEGDNHNPVWRAADGLLTWGSQVEGVRGIRLARPDRPSQVTPLAEAPNERIPESWSPDGARLAFTETHPATGQDILVLSVKSGSVQPFANSAFKETQPRFSRDGRWIAYVSNESGRDEVYIQPSEGNGGRLQISVEGGHSPLWSPDGRELFYVQRAELMAVKVDLRNTPPDIGRASKLLEGPYVWGRLGNFDITPDGRRFVFIRRGESADPPATLRVLLNRAAPTQAVVR